MGPIALVVGELTAHLSLENDGWRRGLRDAKTDMQGLRRDAERETNLIAGRTGNIVATANRAMATLPRDADRRGRESGGALARGFEQGFVRNSPLIVAAIGGALAAGAPVALAGASALFGSIGIAAASTSAQVRSAWRETWEGIRDGAVEDAAAIEPVLIGLADRVGDRFEGMRPQLRGIFSDAAPQIDVFADGLMGLVENALPGFERAIGRSAPVTEAFAGLLRDAGTGLTGFFDGMSEHAPEAATAMEAIGDIFEEVLPLLGDLLGTGAELAEIVLPPLADALGLVADVVDALGPALPAVVGGIAALKVANSVSGGIGTLADKLGVYAAQGGLAAGASGRLSGGLGRISQAAGPLAGTVGFVTAELALWNEAADNAAEQARMLGRAFEVGGSQAEAARGYLSNFNTANDLLDSGIGQTIGSLGMFGTSFRDLVPDVERSRDEYQRWYDTLSVSDRATEDVAIATDRLKDAVGRYGAESPEARAAADELTGAQERQEQANSDLEIAIDGVTTAMINQADQALAGIDSTFGYRRASNQLEDAQATLTETMKDGTASAEDKRRAFERVEEESYRVALAYGQQKADLSGLSKDSAEYARMVQTQMLVKLYQLRDSAGPKMRGAIDQQIAALERSGVSLSETGRKTDTTKGKVKQFSEEVSAVPAWKKTTIAADTVTANRRVAGFQKAVNNLSGKTVEITIQAATSAVRNILANAGLGWAEGGYTGPGGKYDPAGIVHRGEVVWNQQDVAAHGGPQKVDKMRRTRASDLPGYADGGIVLRIDNTQAMNALTRPFNNVAASGAGGGAGDVAANVQSMFNTIRAAFPRAKLNSGFRAGDPGYHGLGRAVDLGESGFPGGMGRPYLGQMAAWIHRNFGRNTKELIYTGLFDTTPDLKNGRPLNYGPATNAAHRNHVHWAMANGGVIREPVVGVGLRSGGSYSFGERGAETVTPGEHGRGGVGMTVHVGQVVVPGSFDMASPAERRKAAEAFRHELIKLDREQR